jgi:hypothetical protein
MGPSARWVRTGHRCPPFSRSPATPPVCPKPDVTWPGSGLLTIPGADSNQVPVKPARVRLSLVAPATASSSSVNHPAISILVESRTGVLKVLKVPSLQIHQPLRAGGRAGGPNSLCHQPTVTHVCPEPSKRQRTVDEAFSW